MKRLLLISTLLPVWAAAQEVKPILSADYLALIKNDSVQKAKGILTDSTNSMRAATLKYTGYNFAGQFTVKQISIGKNNAIKLQPLTTNYFYIGGTASATVEIQQINRQTATQNEYVQGRSASGALQWRGSETGEPFSYGPAVHTLQYDGSNYPYDIKGRLVTQGDGNKAQAYNNSVLRNGSLFSNALTLYTRYKKNYTHLLTATFKAGQGREQTIITTNKNKADNFSAAVDATLNRYILSGSYNFRQERHTHTNRNGFLNRVYQNSLLSPVSFATRQGNTIGTVQRSFSPVADNPFFLLADNGHSFLQQQQTGNLSIEQRIGKLKIKLAQSITALWQNSNEGYQAGTSFFPAGVALQRIISDNNYSLNANMVYNIPFDFNRFKAQATVNYIYANNHSTIGYTSHSAYRYQRSAHDMAISFAPEYNGDDMEAGMTFTNKIYASNTSTHAAYLLPGISGYSRFNYFPRFKYLSVKLFGSFNRFNNELPVDKSFAGLSQLQYSVANALQYLPVTEVNSYTNLSPIRHREYNTGIELSYRHDITFSANWFSRHTSDDMFPVMNAGQMNLVNMASHRSSGIELELSNNDWIWKKKKFSFGNTISFVSFHSKVTSVKEGYNFMPIAGFIDVHKAIVQGQPLGVIMGNTWLRNDAGQRIIGNDGFPLVNNTLSVIGNPVSDFTFKINHRFTYKYKWTLSIDWEWKKGGDIWNGTQALLDYYGRSANSAALRNTTGYVFDGVLANGNHNTIPVNFYDAALPVEQNRWVRYGHSGVAEDYIQKADCLRLQTVSVSYKPTIKKYLQQLSFSLSANNIMIWSAYKGADPNQLLNDQPGGSGLDFFNLPSVLSLGFTISLQF